MSPGRQSSIRKPPPLSAGQARRFPILNMKQSEVKQYRVDLALQLLAEPDKNKRREILEEAPHNPKYDEAKSKTMENRILETYFSEIFFPKVWSKLIGLEGQVETNAKESAEMNGKKLWDSMIPSLDLYAKKFELPQEKQDGESDQKFFKRLVDKMYALNQKNKEHWDAWPAKALEDGAANCSMGSQIAFRVLEKAGFEVEYCSRANFALYLKEMEYRFNHRKEDLTKPIIQLYFGYVSF